MIGVINALIRVTLLTLMFIGQPTASLIGLGMAFTAVPAYFLFVFWENKPKCFQTGYGELLFGHCNACM